MKHGEEIDPGSRTQTTDSRTRSRKWPLFFLLAALVVWSFRSRHGTWSPLNENGAYDQPLKTTEEPFSQVPKPYLDYHDCDFDSLGKYKCALLELPMDYFNGTTNAKVHVAVVKKPAAVPVTHPQYGGPILFNPGGPGGSGVGFVVGTADRFRQLLDDENGKYFDYIGFDPRGVGYSSPLLQCLSDSTWAQTWRIRVLEEGVFSASDAAFGRLWSIAQALGQSCSLPREDGEADFRKYVTTAHVAWDMLEIVEREGEWREKEAERILNGTPCNRRGQATVEVPEALKYKRGEEKINYWGFSYGTYLGNTFAAMYPDRINRLVVDGVVDAYDYERALWMDNLVDTEKDLDQFYFHCARVGPICALANETGETTAEGVKNRTQAILKSLYHNPLPIIDAKHPEVITLSDVKDLSSLPLYVPLQGFPYFAQVLAGIEQGNATLVAPVLRAQHGIFCPLPGEDKPSLAAQPFSGTGVYQLDATLSIACTDGADQSWVSRDDFREHVANLTQLSPSIGDLWALFRLNCINYRLRPYHRFRGPWVGNTSHPILEIGNTADPVTPGRYAKKMAKGFPGAVALIQDSPGHCSSAAPSLCTATWVKLYFQTGQLPPQDTVCQPDVLPFGPTPGVGNVLDAETARNIELHSAIHQALLRSGGGMLRHGTGRSWADTALLS